MGPKVRLGDRMPVAKGVLLFCFDETSRHPEARQRLQGLSDALAAIAPSYAGLEKVFDEHLVRYHFNDRIRQETAEHLRANWFDATSADFYFKGFDVARIYGEGLSRALQESLRDDVVVPLDTWWLVDQQEFKIVVLTDGKSGQLTANNRVTFLVMTPRPAVDAPVAPNVILGESEAWVSEQQEVEVTVRAVRDLR